MKQQNEMPEDGQFVAVWSAFGRDVYSATIRIESGRMSAYNHFDDSWDDEHTYTSSFFAANNAAFFIKD